MMKATKEEKDEIAGTPVKKSKKKKKDNSTKPLKTKTDKPPGLHKKTRKVISEEVEFEGTTNNGCKKGEKKMKHKEGKVAEEEKLESEEAGQHLKKTKKSVKNEVCLESCDTPVKKKKKKKKMEELIHGDSTNGNADALELAREDHDELLKKRKKSKVKVLKIAEETKVASAELLVESVGKTKKKKNHHHPLEPVGEDLDELPKKRKKSKVKVLKIAEETKDADAKLLVESVGKTKKKKKHCHPLELVGEDHDELPKKRKKSKVKVLKMTEETKDADAKLLVESVGKTKKKKKHCHPLELVGEDHDELPKKRKKSKVKVLKMTEETKAAGAKLLVKSVGKTKKKKRKHCHSEETSEETLPKRKKVREAGDTASEDEEKCVKKASLMEGKAGKKAKKSQEVHHKEEDGGQTCNVKKKKKLKRKEGVSCRIEEMAKWEEDPKGLSRSDVEGSPGSKISKKKVKVEEEPTAEPVKKQKKDKLKKRSKTDGHQEDEEDVELVEVKRGNMDEVTIDQTRRRALQEEVDRESGRTKGSDINSRRALQEEIDRESGSNPVSDRKLPASKFGQWDTATFQSSEQQQKFLRLMGGLKKSSRSPELGGRLRKHVMALNQTEENTLNQSLKLQFEKAMNIRQRRGVGLGFQPVESKKFFIDTSASRSIKFD
nr:PREDICTED: lysine-rich nucleolar protein 1 isoform X3 [Latimeria chalumnae]|eukprot:XP_005999692.1 PREDICTED: lysine-rich nucleolar protein 1 isoform X3 [Latimeria chalumnae]